MRNSKENPEYKLDIGGKLLLLDQRKFALLDGIERYGSIMKSSQEAGIPYRTAQKYIEIMETVLDSQVVLTKRGGKGGGGGSQLTDTGKVIIKELQNLTVF